jgi:SAM-dependent methyltransferase
MVNTDQQKLIESWRREERHPFIGWDFSYLESSGRMIEEQAPWSYTTRAAELLRRSAAVLDMGTGGGERLLALRGHWPKKVVATEDYPPNFALATERLAPLGVTVVRAELSNYAPMPFSDAEFDLVLNRHSGFNCHEVARMLAPGGTFYTQQVDGLWAHDLQAVFGARPKWPEATLVCNGPKLEAVGLTLLRGEAWAGKLIFTDVGAIVYYLRAVPWMVSEFSVDTHLEGLLRLQDRLDNGGNLVFAARKYLIEARKM